MADADLAYEKQLEDNLITWLLADDANGKSSPLAGICRHWGKSVDSEIFPAVLVRAENISDDFPFGAGNSGVMKGDLMIQVTTYRLDDKDGTVFDGLISATRNKLWRTDLVNQLNAVSAYTYYGTKNLDSIDDPDGTIYRKTLQLHVKFSPIK